MGIARSFLSAHSLGDARVPGSDVVGLIAALLRIHQTTVSQHISYALKKLHQVLPG